MSPLDTASPIELAAVFTLALVCIAFIVSWLLREHRGHLTRITSPSSFWVGECLECGMKYRHYDPFEVQAWANDHQRERHGAR